MSTIEEKFQVAKHEILGEPPSDPKAKIVYNRAEEELSPIIREFETAISDEAFRKRFASSLVIHFTRIDMQASPAMQKLEEDMQSRDYSNARKRFVERYRKHLPLNLY